MGLLKQRTLPNGITLGYHRIVSLVVTVNVQNVVEVGSYVSLEQRIGEHENLLALQDGATEAPNDVYIDTTYFVLDYDPTMSVTSAYEWLKQNVDWLEDAADELEYSQSDISPEEEA